MDLLHLCQAHKGKFISVLTLQHHLCATVKHAPASNSLVTDHNECVDGDDIIQAVCQSVMPVLTHQEAATQGHCLAHSIMSPLFNYSG